ncbi:MAG: diadenylate cyclase CdaA [Bacteroidales bacterium]|nr:diadenylate cyclase CdaA [Bacteroidales bacterium]
MLLLSILKELPSFNIFDLIDIVLVGVLLFYVIKLLKGTNAISILIGFLILFIAWKVVSMLGMKILSEILGQFISLGVMALIIIFQPEIRKFLILIGSRSFTEKGKKFFFWKYSTQNSLALNTNAIVQACSHMSSTYTGALIIFCRDNKLESVIASGEVFQSELSSQLLETIFFKNTPLHDGAVIIDDGKIQAARCILPVSHANNIPLSMGLRHRSALGITENSDAIAVVVSEQTGKISVAIDGHIKQGVSTQYLQELLDKEFNKSTEKPQPQPQKSED